MTSRLTNAISPYLLQHAGNPVDWWEWGPEAFAEAKRRDVPVLLSIGYAACHWCHVMAHESFEDEAVAALVNDNFVAIKVDREERPDVDAIYMQATQALTGQGGWPMTVFCTADGRPFFAGTYYPPTRRGQMPAFAEVLAAIVGAWRDRRDEVDVSAQAIAGQLEVISAVEAAPLPKLREVIEAVQADFDPIHGGFGRAPKFPNAMLLDALVVKAEPACLDMVQRSLAAMARGGIHDQVVGGFARYSVDAGWAVPHFEKMLYDNALLLGTYVRGWRRTPDHEPLLRAQFERVVRGIVGWLERELRTEQGGFAASLDADSADIRGMPHEGIYYVWSPDLLADALGEEDALWAAGIFHVTTEGTFEHGLSTLQLRGNPDPGRLAEVSGRLLQMRSRRFAPARDDKVVAAWNGLAIDSLVTAALVFDEPGWLELARGAAQHVWDVHWVDGRLCRVSRDGSVGEAAGLAEDYGALALGLARLAGATGDAAWLARARELTGVLTEHFGAADGGFFDTADDAEPLFRRPRDVTDNATPSGTSCAVAALRLVGLLADDPALLERADAAAATTWAPLAVAPRFAGWALSDALIADDARTGLARASVVVVADDPLNELTRAAWRMAPAGSAIVTGPAGTSGFGDLFVDRGGDVPTAYVCRGVVCFEPVTTIEALRDALWRRA